MRRHILIGLVHALGVAGYVALVALVMLGAERWIGEPKTIVGPIAFLLLFVTSAAITGSLVLGRPILAYLDGRKADAVRMFLATIGWLVVLLAIAFTVLVIQR